MSVFQRDSYHVLFNLDEFRFSLKGLQILAGAFLGVHALAAIISPFLYKVVVWWYMAAPNALNEWMISRPFPEYYDRLRILLFLLIIPWLLLQCRLLSAGKLGFHNEMPWYQSFLRFYLGGAVTIMLVLTLLLVLGEVQFAGNLSLSGLVLGLVFAFMAAFAIGFVEELMFRSIFFRIFYTAFTPGLSLLVANLFFSYLHFKKIEGLWDVSTPPEEVVFGDGFRVAFWILTGFFANFSLVLFINYALVGYIFTVVFMRTRSIWASMGLHAGWVTPLLWFRNLGMRIEEDPSLWWGTYQLVDGYFCTLLLLPFAFYLTRIYKPARPRGFAF